MSLGPVEYALFAFDGNRFTGAIAPALVDLVESGTVRIIDLSFITKDADGSVLTLELADLPPEASDPFASLDYEVDDLLTEDDLLAEAELLPPDTSAAVVVWENLWARRLADAVRAAGGTLVDQGRVDPALAEAVMALHLADTGTPATTEGA